MSNHISLICVGINFAPFVFCAETLFLISIWNFLGCKGGGGEVYSVLNGFLKKRTNIIHSFSLIFCKDIPLVEKLGNVYVTINSCISLYCIQ